MLYIKIKGYNYTVECHDIRRVLHERAGRVLVELRDGSRQLFRGHIVQRWTEADIPPVFRDLMTWKDVPVGE
jgi:hypothetical protein